MAKRSKVTHHETLSMAFFEAQTEFGPIYADGINPEKGYAFRTLEAMLDALKPILHKNGLAFTQIPDGVESHDGRPTYMLKTIIMHAKTGEQLVGRYPVCDARLDAHSKATCQTLARRYSIPPMMGVSAESEGQEPAHAKNADPDGIDQRPEDERPLLAGPGLGAIKDKLIEEWSARMRACSTTEDVDAVLAEALEYPHGRFSDNAVDGLRTVADEERERIKAGVAPRDPTPSSFEELQAEGLACAKVERADEAIGAYARWLSRVNSKTRLATCTPDERKTLQALKKTVKGEIDARLRNSAASPPHSAADTEGAPGPDTALASKRGAPGAPSTQQETEQMP